jgi:hypothetical protein
LAQSRDDTTQGSFGEIRDEVRDLEDRDFKSGVVSRCERFVLHGVCHARGRVAAAACGKVRGVRESWSGYWSAPGGRRAAAIVRIAIAASVLLTLWRLGGAGMAADADAAPRTLYRPISWWLIFGAHAPAAGVVQAPHVVAWSATFAMLVGLWSRVATVVSLVAALGLAAYAVSFAPTWSLVYNVVFLAQLAFVGARGGDAWSVDAWWRARRGRDVAPPDAAYAWSLRLAQLAVALMFLSAFACKLAAGGGTLAWALSDNLRHQLLSRFDLIGVPRTAAADWLLAAPWRWQAAALGNLVSQAAPIGAVFAVRRPWLRAAFGAFFVVETVALGVVMDLWNLHWLPLAAVFVDWDALFGARAAAAAATPRSNVAPSRAARRFVVAFVAYDVLVSFAPRLDQALRTYPFYSFPMFAKVLAKRPYDRHQSYELVGARVEVVASAPIEPSLQRWIDQSYEYRTMWKLRADPAALERRLRALLADVRARAGRGVRIDGLRLHLALFQAPAVPAPARLRTIPFLVLAEVAADGRFRMY